MRGTVHSSVALGILLAEGLGDTVRVSLTADPTLEVRTGIEILRALGLRASGPSVTSCPTCGRTRCDVQGVAEQVEAELAKLAVQIGSKFAFPRVAVMGCVVNGPGEAKHADIALCGGKGEFFFYEGGECKRRLPESDAVRAVVEAVREWVLRRMEGGLTV